MNASVTSRRIGVRRALAPALMLAAALLCGLGPSTPAQAADPPWPTRPVRWVVPFPPGGAMDSIARTLGEKATKALGQPFVIENKPGAGGNIGTELVARSAPDGQTILITSIGMATNPSLYSKLNYDPQRDLAPVSLLAIVPNVLVTNDTQPGVKTVRDVIEAARRAPGKLTYASAGNGTSIHLAGELFTAMAGIDMVHIPYRGSGPAVTDMLAGQVNYMFDSITSAGPHIRSGRLRAIAVTTATRSKSLPDVPTIAESGLPGYEVAPWFAVFAPAGTPQAVIDRLNATLREAMQEPDVVSKFQSIGAEPIGSSPQALAEHLRKETALWSKLIRERNIRSD